jgi:signal transduction histidine kinase
VGSIQSRVLWSSFTLVTLTAVILGAVTYFGVLRETEALFDYQLKQMALSLRDQTIAAPAEQLPAPPEATDFVVDVWTTDGSAVYYSRYVPGMPKTVALGYATIEVSGAQWRMYSLGVGKRVIRVAQPMVVRQRLAASAAVNSVAPLLALAPLFALAAWWVVGFSLSPLRRVATEVKGLQAQTLVPLATAGLPSEIEPLVGSLNALLARLRGAFETQQAFVADAAHELRTPLTALKLQLEVLRRAADAPARAEATERLAAGIERARHLVEQLLSLARAEPGPAAPGPAAARELDLSELARTAIVDAVPLAAARGIELALEHDPGIDGSRLAAVLVGPPDAPPLSVLVRNLVDNAVRYGRDGGRVIVHLGQNPLSPQCLRLIVDDDGPGIPSDERERVFDRFYRRHPGETIGSGLGLAIVRAIADRYGASITLTDSPLGGLRVLVDFPATAPAAAGTAPAVASAARPAVAAAREGASVTAAASGKPLA